MVIIKILTAGIAPEIMYCTRNNVALVNIEFQVEVKLRMKICSSEVIVALRIGPLGSL